MKQLLLGALIATAGLGPLPAQAGIWESCSDYCYGAANWIVKKILGKIIDYPQATATVACGMAYPYYNYNLSLLDPFGKSLLSDCKTSCDYRSNFETQNYSTIRTACIGYFGSLALAAPLEAFNYHCDPTSFSLSSVTKKLTTSALPIFLGSGILNKFIPEEYHQYTAWTTMCIPHISHLYASYVRSNVRQQILQSTDANEIKQVIKQYDFQLTVPELEKIKNKFKSVANDYACFDYLQKCATAITENKMKEENLWYWIKQVCLDNIAPFNSIELTENITKNPRFFGFYEVRENRALLEKIAKDCRSYAVLAKLKAL